MQTHKHLAILSRTQLRVFDAKDMKRVFLLNNPLAKEKNRAFTTDRPSLGRDRAAAVSHTHNMSVERSPHDDVAKAFAREVAAILKRDYFDDRSAQVLIAAEPRMLGWLKAIVGDESKDRLEWLSKDLGKLSDSAVKNFFLGSKQATQ